MSIYYKNFDNKTAIITGGAGGLGAGIAKTLAEQGANISLIDIDSNKLKKTTHMGDAVKRFENKISKLFSKKYGLMVNSGSSALMLATNVLNFKI